MHLYKYILSMCFGNKTVYPYKLIVTLSEIDMFTLRRITDCFTLYGI